MICAKGYLTYKHRLLLLIFVACTLLSIIVRLLYYPIESALPIAMQDRLEYLLFIPLGAFLVVFVRLTLGIRLLGPFRSILIAIAFQVTGILLGLVFMTVVTMFIVMIRPFLKKIRLPYFGRTSFILSAVACIVVAVVFCAAFLEIDSLRRVMYFPIVVLSLIGEGVSRTVTKEGWLPALWRSFTTILVAIVITGLANIPGFSQILITFPELLLLQIAGIVFISEYLDLRLLDRPKTTDEEEAVESQLSPRPVNFTSSPLKIAVVRNRKNKGIIRKLGRPCPEINGRGTVQRVMDALRSAGHTVKAFEADMTMLSKLKNFLQLDKETDELGGIVFNMSYGIQGDARYCHTPSMLEIAGIPYVAANPLGHALSLDKVTAKILMQAAGVPTPAFVVLESPEDSLGNLRFPLIVKPRHESTSYGLYLVNDAQETRDAAAEVLQKFRQSVLVEEYITGREVTIGLLGNDPVEFLPPVELQFPGKRIHVLTWNDKYHKSTDEPRKICPANISTQLKSSMEQIALRTYQTCFCRDYARIDFRVDEQGNPFVLEINSLTSLGKGGAYVYSALEAGYTFNSLICRILEVAMERIHKNGYFV